KFGMYNRLETGFTPGVFRLSARPENVLAIPRLDTFIIPDLPAYRVVTNIALAVEQRLPVGRPLAVDMMLTGLGRASRTEQYRVGMDGNRRNKAGAATLGQMLCDFETECHVETVPEIEGTG